MLRGRATFELSIGDFKQTCTAHFRIVFSTGWYDWAMSTGPSLDAILDLLQNDRLVAAAVLFGSAARGQLRADSDFDLALLYFDRKAHATNERSLLAELGKLGLAVGRDVHLIDLEAADSGLRHSIFATGQILLDRSGGRLRQLRHATAIEYVDWDYARRTIDAGQRRQLEQALG
jgi:predicted nucleotidyltransferase